MPEIRLKSQQKEPRQRDHKVEMHAETGQALRRRALAQLTSIQINTAGLSGPYRSDEETMERVCGNHAAVRSLRIVLRRSLILPRRGPLCYALLAWVLKACGDKHTQAARSLGITVRELRSVLDSQRSPVARRQPHLSLVE